ncbi:hypothetical protein [Streptomyces nymphaeiformis]|uniref:Uncharacterized protein n=1 Tax=Streptomyces nymphaeiformis TaxID=2663842 RepID=A0A7W7TXU1_9ACTN|nr:hypothetical protein [Streptomyces nymphaeiformis]MBB4981336.1 hypothetical protein [Streptomyces nymphaeiformis]
MNDDANSTVGAGATVTGGPAAGGSDVRTGAGPGVPGALAPGAVTGVAGTAVGGPDVRTDAGAAAASASVTSPVAVNAVGTAVLLAAAPAGRGRAMDAASVLPALAAVPPGVLTGTTAATVVELADPLDPQTVLTRLRAAAASPGPLVVCLAGQLHLDRRQQLPHLALARTTQATLRYTALPWHWLAGELGVRQPGTTTVVADLAADPDVWQRLTAAPGLLHLGPGPLLYGRVVPAPRRGEPTTPEYLRAWAELWRSGARLTPASAHAEAAARATTVSPAPEPVFLTPGLAPPGAPAAGPETRHAPAPGSVPSPGPAPAPGPATGPPAAWAPAPGPEAVHPAGTAPAPAPGAVHPAGTAPAPAPGAVHRAGTAAVPGPGGVYPAGTAAAPGPGDVHPASGAVVPGSPVVHPGGAAPGPGAGAAYPVDTAATPGAAAVRPARTAPAPGPTAVPPARTAPASVSAPPPAPVSAPVPVTRPAPAFPPVPAPPPARAHASAGAAVDPHPAILSAAMAGRHGEAAAVAAAWEHEALRRHGPRSVEAVHWTEVRADLARLAGEPARSCELWIAAAEARLGLHQRPDDPDVEGAVDRAHHQWEHIEDPGRARAIGPLLVDLRRRVPGRRPGALAALTRRMG